MTPDGCRGSFLAWMHLPEGDPGRGSGEEKRAGKIRPNTVIISHSVMQVNGKSGPELQNLCSAQKQMCAFRKHSVLKS